MLLLLLKLHNFWWGIYFAVVGEQRRVVLGALKGGSCPYDSEVVELARSCEQWTFYESRGGAAIDLDQGYAFMRYIF